MNRDIDFDTRQDSLPEKAGRHAEIHSAEVQPSREHGLFRMHGYIYRVSTAELETMQDIGRFRTVAVADLGRYRYTGNDSFLHEDLRSLRAQGLVQLHSVWSGPRSQKLAVAVLTNPGKELLERHGKGNPGQASYAGFVKPAEVRHDAAIYRMYHAEKEKIERAGGRIHRVVLDFELKKKVYSPLAKAKALGRLAYAKRQSEVAKENGLTVIQGKIPLPDLRIEYLTSDGDIARVDLELATGHYHGRALQTKAEAGFKMYAADSASRLSRALEERDIIAAILSL